MIRLKEEGENKSTTEEENEPMHVPKKFTAKKKKSAEAFPWWARTYKWYKKWITIMNASLELIKIHKILLKIKKSMLRRIN